MERKITKYRRNASGSVLNSNRGITFQVDLHMQNGDHMFPNDVQAGMNPFSRSLASLSPNGRYLPGNPRLSDRVRGKWSSGTGSMQMIVGASVARVEDLAILRELIEAGQLKSAIDRRYPPARTAEVHRYVDTGQKAENVVIIVSQYGEPDPTPAI